MRPRRCTAVVAAALASAVALVPAEPALSAPAVSLDPGTALVDRQRVEVRGSGMPANDILRLRQCWAGATDDAHCDVGDGEQFALTGAGGRFSTRLTLDATPRPEDGAPVDCRQPAVACTLVVFGVTRPGEAVLASVALAFDPGAPLAPPPRLTLTPPADLLDGLSTSLVGTGFRPGLFPIRQCRSPVQGPASCTSVPLAFAPVASDGAFEREFVIEATIGLADGEHRDCRAADCVLLAGDPDDLGEAGVLSLLFTPDGPLAPPPSLAVPAPLLVDSQLLTPTGRGYRPRSAVALWECLAADLTPAGCTPLGTATSRADGRLAAAPVRVDAWLRTPAGEADCRSAVPACLLVAGDPSDPDDVGRTPLRFRPDSPVRPPRGLELDPATPLRDGQLVTVRGVGFRVDEGVELAQCPAAAATAEPCSAGVPSYFDVGAGGTFTTRVAVARTITTEDGVVDCGTPGQCVLRATTRAGGLIVVNDLGEDLDQGIERTDVGLVFRSGSAQRYVDVVFPDVDVTRGVLYRTAVGADGRPVELRLDVYRPAGDTEQQRPAVVWIHGGYFLFGDRRSMEAYALDSARRGYVAVSIDYRLSPRTDGDAIQRALVDARAAVRWLQAEATTYGVDPASIAAGGSSAGAVTALNLAYAPALSLGHRSGVKAAVSLSGTRTFGAPEAGEPPSLLFHGTEDTVVPFGAAVETCAFTQAAGASCRLVRYEDTGHGLDAFSPHIQALSARFLSQHLRP